MDESGFRNWLAIRGARPKLVSDTVCRIKRFVEATGFDLDSQYGLNSGSLVMLAFKNRGQNDIMSAVPQASILPIGKYSMATYKMAVRRYYEYLGDRSTKDQI